MLKSAKAAFRSRWWRYLHGDWTSFDTGDRIGMSSNSARMMSPILMTVLEGDVSFDSDYCKHSTNTVNFLALSKTATVLRIFG